MPEVGRFNFGKNWEQYLKRHFNEERVEISRKHLLQFLDIDNLKDKYFLDVGCGSGLHSLAALRAGAAQIVSFDIDPNSVNTTRKIWGGADNPAHWEIKQGSILDDAFLQTLEPADIVYAWGVLHHTGHMWKAMNNAVRLMKNQALFYVALYDYDFQVNPPAEFWLEVKQKYNRGGWVTKRQMELWYIWRFMLYKNLRALPVFIRRILRYKESRGMAVYTDLVDWLGGWPMEFAKRADVKQWAENVNLEMVKMKTGQANTEYLFKR